MEAIKLLNYIITILFFVCYAYQFFYIGVPLLRKPRPHRPSVPHRFAVLISARNEEAVIGNLIASIQAQTYDASLVDIFVVADNCTDKTADVAAAAGAKVWKRFDLERVGKAMPSPIFSTTLTAGVMMASLSLTRIMYWMNTILRK